MRTGSRNGVSLRNGIVLDDLGFELSAKLAPLLLGVRGVGSLKTHNIWNLWTRSPLIYLRGVSGWYCFGLHMSTAFVLVEHHQTWNPGGQGGLRSSGEARSLAYVYVKGKERSTRIFSFFWNGHHQPAWYKRSFGVFYRVRKGAAFLNVEVYEIALSCMSTDNATASGKTIGLFALRHYRL